MEIRENPYEDLDVGEGHNDRTVEIPFNETDDLDTKIAKMATGQKEVSPLALKLSNPDAGAQTSSIQNLGLQLNANKTDKTAKGMPSMGRQKHTLVKLGIPALDLSGLKNVKEYKDWYGYS